MTWWESNDHCLGEGGKLVEIDSAAENTALAEEISREYPDRSINFWMGLRDAQREGDWRLASNGLEPSFLNWHPGQPDNYENEDCAWFRTGSNVSNVWEKQWFDIKCNANANFGPFPIFLHALCEFDNRYIRWWMRVSNLLHVQRQSIRSKSSYSCLCILFC